MKKLTILLFCAAIFTTVAGMSSIVSAGQEEAELITLLNQDRKAKGRKPLLSTPELMAAAENHAQDMVTRGYFSHTGKDGSTFADRIKRQGYKFCYAAENIASGQKTASKAMSSWRNSAGHRKNNLGRKPTHVGAGFAGDSMWVLVFAKPC